MINIIGMIKILLISNLFQSKDTNLVKFEKAGYRNKNLVG